jgi:hypothetical protein
MVRVVIEPIRVQGKFTRTGPFRGTQGPTSSQTPSITVSTASPPNEDFGDTLIAVIGTYSKGGFALVNGITHTGNPLVRWKWDAGIAWPFPSGDVAGVEIWRANGGPPNFWGDDVGNPGTINVDLGMVPYPGSGPVTLVGAIADVCGYNLSLGPFPNLLDRVAYASCGNTPPTSADDTFTGWVSTSKPGWELWVGGITHLGNDQQTKSTVSGMASGFDLLDGMPAFGVMSVGYLDKVNVDYNGWSGPFPVAGSGVHVSPNWYVGCIATYSSLSTYLP